MYKKLSGFIITEQCNGFLSLGLFLEVVFSVITSWKLLCHGKGAALEHRKTKSGQRPNNKVSWLSPLSCRTSDCGVLSQKVKKRPNLTLAMSPLAVKGTSHPGWGPFFMVTQKDNVAYVSRSLAMVSATQVWAPLLLANHLETRQVAARRERVQEIWEGGCRLGRQHEHRDPFQPKVTSEGEAALCTWQGQACCGKAWAASGLFFA